MYSLEHKKYLKKRKKEKIIITFFRAFIIVFFLVLWELLARKEIINPFLTSSPSKVYNTVI